MIEAESGNTAVSDAPACWPALPPDAWQDTRDTLHMWAQIVGKVRLALTPKENHWWNAALPTRRSGFDSRSAHGNDAVVAQWLERLPRKQRVGGSNPPRGFDARLASEAVKRERSSAD